MVDERPARGQALAILRGLRAWSQQELAEAAGLTRATIGGYEQGTHALTPRKLWELARVMGHSKEKVRDVLRLFGSPAVASERWVGPVRFTAAEERALRDFGDQESRRTGFTLRKLLRQARVQEATHQDRKVARELWVNLRAERRLRKAIQEKPEYQTWAISELLCEESIQAAPSRPDRALELAEAAVLAAELAPGEERWRLRVLGYAQAHLGNAWRVIGEMLLADEAFRHSKAKWRAGEAGDQARLLNEGRVFGLEASLRREQDRPQEALVLLEEGLEVSNAKERSYLLISKAKALAAARNYEEALAELRTASQCIEKNKPHLASNLRFELAVSLCNLGRFTEAARLLPELQRLSLQKGQQIFCLRMKWLEGKVSAGIGSAEQAVAILSMVREEFTTLGMLYDAALVSMELAEVLLQLKRIAQVKMLVRQMAPIFVSQKIPEKALQALLLFRRAAETEAVTVRLVRSIGEYLRRAWGRPELEYSPLN